MLVFKRFWYALRDTVLKLMGKTPPSMPDEPEASEEPAATEPPATEE